MNRDRIKAKYAAVKTKAVAYKDAHPRFFWGTAAAGGAFLALVLFLALFDGRSMAERIATGIVGHPVHITGDFHIAWSFAPRIEATNITVDNPDWVGKPHLAEVETVSLKIKLLPLIVGKTELPEFLIHNPKVALVRQASGRSNWEDDGTPASEAAQLPLINRFVLDGGVLTIADAKRRIAFEGTFSSNEQVSDNAEGAFELKGNGRLNRNPFSLTLQGPPLINASPSKPYAFDADLRDGGTRLSAKGRIEKPFDLGQISASLTVSGPDLADLYYLTGLALPNTPPYSLSGNLTRNETVYRFEKFAGRVGDSDLNGTLSVDAAPERPFLEATLNSKKLDFDDLGTLFGGHPATGAGETASPAQRATAARQTASDRLLPDTPLDVARVRSMDAKVHYTADAVQANDVPLREVSLDVSLNDGVLKLDPISLKLDQGLLTGNTTIDARKDVPAVALDLRLSNANLEQFFADKGEISPLTGPLVARGKLTGYGASIASAAATSDGTISFVVPRGEIRHAFAELLGINVAEGLGLLLSDDQEKVAIRCAVANFSVKNGILSADTVAFDTEPVLAIGKGTVNLKTEEVDLALEGHAKQFRVLRLLSPITITGRLAHPAIGIDAGKAAAQGSLAAALGAFLTPLAAILPFVSPGLEEDADCGALLAESQAKGAPKTR